MRRRKALGLLANKLAIIRQAGLEVRLRDEGVRIAGRQRSFRLRNVGAGDFADRKTVSHLTQLLFEDVDVVATQIQNRRVAQHVHI